MPGSGTGVPPLDVLPELDEVIPPLVELEVVDELVEVDDELELEVTCPQPL